MSPFLISHDSRDNSVAVQINPHPREYTWVKFSLIQNNTNGITGAKPTLVYKTRPHPG